jgi:hypothetical protein
MAHLPASTPVASVVSAVRAAWRRVPLPVAWIAVGLIVCAEAFVLLNHQTGGSGNAPAYWPRTAALRRPSLELFAPDSGYGTPRAVIVFFGNDVGFWKPHRRLAAGLARDGYAVVGVDIRPVLGGATDDAGPHAAIVRLRLDSIIEGAYAEFAAMRTPSAPDLAAEPSGRTSVPLLLAGHSLGAELALWAAGSMRLPTLRGVLAISPGSRSHLIVTASDLLMTSEPVGPGSFAVSDLVRTIVTERPDVRMAVVRGSNDPLGWADSALLAAGESSIRRFSVPMAGHSMKRIGLAGLVVRRALDWVLVTPPPLGTRTVSP